MVIAHHFGLALFPFPETEHITYRVIQERETRAKLKKEKEEVNSLAPLSVIGVDVKPTARSPGEEGGRCLRILCLSALSHHLQFPRNRKRLRNQSVALHMLKLRHLI